MKLVLELEGIGYIGVRSNNYIVFAKFNEGTLKSGEPYKIPASPKFFMSLSAALEELRCYAMGKKLAFARTHAKSIDELMAKIDKINKEWDAFYHDKRLVCEKELKIKSE